MASPKPIKVNFNLRTPSITDKPSAVKCVIRWNNQTLTLYSVESILPKFWNPTTQRAKSNRSFPQSAIFNEHLDKIEKDIKEAYTTYLMETNAYPTVPYFKAVVEAKLNNTPKANKDSLFHFIQLFINESTSRNNIRTGKPLSDCIINNYKRSLRLLKDYAKENKKFDLSFKDITLEFYNDYKQYMMTVKGFSTNTIGKHIKTLKTFLNDATEKKYETVSDFKSKKFQTIKEEVKNIYLNEQELNYLYNLDLSHKPKLENARDLFLVGCWTGLRFSDYSNLKKEHIVDNEYIEIETKKTRQKVIIPLHPIVKSIIAKYADKTENSLPRRISNQKLNEYLKEVGEIAKFTNEESFKRTVGGKETIFKKPKFEMITSHTARRSFATNMYQKNAPSISIMAITGHNTEKAFLNYIKAKPREHADKLKSFF
ncbi:site-specific integrase [Pedobacter sp.]